MIETARLILRRWRAEDRPAYAALRADPEVAKWLGGPELPAQAEERAARYDAGFEERGIGRWAIERRSDRAFIGVCGIMPAFRTLPVAPTPELGWHLIRAAWGRGYATEAAAAALADGFVRLRDASEILALTTLPNAASRAVAARIGMIRDPTRDFDHPEIADGPLRRQIVYAAPRAR